MKPKAREDIPERKLKEVKDLSDLIKNKKTILVASIKNLPASQFQEISKKLRGKAIVKVPKKNLIFRAIDNSKNSELSALKDKIADSSAILFSDMDSFELAGELIKNKSPAKAKPGQESPEDIEIPEGPTELMSGPVISDFGALGIQIQIDKGKIVVKKAKIIAKKGEKISENAANMMGKLDIKPFSIGFIPLSAFDKKENKLYTEIKISTEEAIKEMKELFGKALAFAVEMEYFSSDTIKFIIGKAGIEFKAMEKILGEEKSEEETEENKEEVKEDTQTPEEKTGEENK